jgi:hypothetical protein
VSRAKTPRTLATTTVVDSCGACHWWKSAGAIGTCKRFPPVPLASAGCVQPITEADNWCGEFHQAVEQAQKPVGFVRPAEQAA